MKATLSLAVVCSLSIVAPIAAQNPGASLGTPSPAAAVREGLLLPRPKQRASLQQAHSGPTHTRHRSAVGAIVGASVGSAAGSVILMSACHGGGEGVCSPPGAALWIGMFAGIGVGSGAAVGALSGR